MDDARLFKSTQEQAVAAWIDHLNQLRINELIEKLAEQNMNLDEALSMLNKIRDFVASPQNILGSDVTKHGEIAEYVQVYVSNARKVIEGLKPEYTFEGVNRLAPEDYLKNGAKIQSKFYAGELGKQSFEAICKHLNTYPDFIKDGGTYDIPKDQYEHIVDILNKKSSQLTRSEATLVSRIREWETSNGISFTEKVNPSVADYSDVQVNTVEKTINNEETSIRDKDSKIRDQAYEESKPSFEQGVKATVASAAIEGGVSFCLKVYEKIKSEKKISEFTTDDWKDIGITTAKGTGTGAIRGGTIYLMTNYTATPAAVAASLVTAVIGTITQAYKFKKGELNEEEFLVNSQVLTLEAAISAISSLIGQVAIPIPVLGAVIGNVTGNYLLGIAEDYCSQEEQHIIDGYRKDIAELTKQLDERYKMIVEMLAKEFKKYSSLVELAFDIDVNKAFYASIALAEYVGVDGSRILRTKSDIDNYFTL